MIKIIHGALFVTIILALGACNLFAPASADSNSLVAANPALGLTIQIQNATDVFNAVGQIINYNYVVTYTGSAPLAGPAAVADAQSAVTCPDVNTVGNLNSALDKDETLTCK